MIGSRYLQRVCARLPRRQGWPVKNDHALLSPLLQRGRALLQAQRWQDRFQMVHNGVDVSDLDELPGESAALRARLGIPAPATVVGLVARVGEQKDPELWMEVAARVGAAHPDAHFVWVGDGPLRQPLEDDARVRGLASRVHCVGAVGRVAPWYRLMDVLLLTSRFEGLCNAVLEAQVCGVPVVCPPVGGVPEAFQDGASGLLVDPPTVEHFAERVLWVLDHPEWRASAAQAGRAFVCQKFGLAALAQATLKLWGVSRGAGRPGPTNLDAAATITPARIRLEASTACQLRCPSCPTTDGRIGKGIGTGFLRFEDFKRLIDDNPWLADIELSNWGEIFLNPDLRAIIEYAHRQGVALRANNGVNLNTVKEEVLEALVKFKFRRLVCSIDGASEAVYGVYRRRGSFARVIENVRTLNGFKARYRSALPRLVWQFVAFGHNQHEIATARRLAAELHMDFCVMLSWGDMYDTGVFSPVTDRELIARESGAGVADREEYRRTHGVELARSTCAQLWVSPQINWDGRVLGCCVNYWGDFGNAFHDGLEASLNSERMSYARQMLTGHNPARADIPCTRCKLYAAMQAEGRWLSAAEIESPPPVQRRQVP